MSKISKVSKMNLDDKKLTELQSNIQDASAIIRELKLQLKKAKKARRKAKQNEQVYLKNQKRLKKEAEAEAVVTAMIKELQKA